MAHGKSSDPDSARQIGEFVRVLKGKIPAADHGALESRLQALMNDADAGADDVVSILAREFDPAP